MKGKERSRKALQGSERPWMALKGSERSRRALTRPERSWTSVEGPERPGQVASGPERPWKVVERRGVGSGRGVRGSARNPRRGAPGRPARAAQVYVLGGYNGSTALASGEKLDLATGVWSSVARMKEERWGCAAVVAAGAVRRVPARFRSPGGEGRAASRPVTKRKR